MTCCSINNTCNTRPYWSNKRESVKMTSIQAGDDLPSDSDSDAELQYSPEKANGRGPPPFSHYHLSPEHQPVVSALGGSSGGSPLKKEPYPPPDFKDE